MTTIAWLVALVVCFALGIVLGRFMAPGTEKARRLEQERDEARAELKRYRDDVRSHFEKTASLFNQVTGTYRQLYEHLAEGSERLGTGESARLLEREPEYRTLRSPEEVNQAVADDSGAHGAGPEGETEVSGQHQEAESHESGETQQEEPRAETRDEPGDGGQDGAAKQRPDRSDQE